MVVHSPVPHTCCYQLPMEKWKLPCIPGHCLLLQHSAQCKPDLGFYLGLESSLWVYLLKLLLSSAACIAVHGSACIQVRAASFLALGVKLEPPDLICLLLNSVFSCCHQFKLVAGG